MKKKPTTNTKEPTRNNGNGNGATHVVSRSALSLNNVLARNLVMERALWLKRQLDPRRDIEAECGHPAELTIENYYDLWERGDIAARVVKVWPEECWSESPMIYEVEDEEETDFEEQWRELQEKFNLCSLLQLADVLSGIGTFGVVLLGIDDGARDLSAPVSGINNRGEPEGDETPKRNLLFARAFDEKLVKVDKLETDITNPRYGLPLMYSLQLQDASNIFRAPGQPEAKLIDTKVHWTRILHLYDNRTSSNIYGMPRMKLVINRLLDLKKIAGGSGEMFWKGGFPGLAIEAMLDADEQPEMDTDAIKEDMDRYQNGLQRYITLLGAQAKTLSPNIADPIPHIDSQIKLIAAALGVPWRIFVGSEAAQLASEQDSRSWNRRVARRRREYLNPFVIKPFIERLILFGVLPKPEQIEIWWPDLNSASDQDKALVAERKTNAITKYVQAGADLLIPPFHFLTLVVGLTDDEARSVIEAAEEQGKEPDDRLIKEDEQKAAIELEKVKAKLKPKPAMPRRGSVQAPAKFKRVQRNKDEKPA